MSQTETSPKGHSYFQELLFGTISWDYSNLWFNINGRTSLLHCTYWGIGGVLFMKYVMLIYLYLQWQQLDKMKEIERLRQQAI